MPREEVILLVEDRHDDEVLMLRSFARAGIKNPVHVAREGEEAVAYLSGAGKYSNRDQYPLPALVLLDLKMPRMDGFEVLKWIRAHSQLSRLPVVVLTSSREVRDVNLAYRLGANSFLVKPMDFGGFVELSNFISEHWFLWMETSAAPKQSCQDWEPRDKKVLLRRKGSREFYGGSMAWVGEKGKALDFERIELAEAVATAEQIVEAEIVVAYEQLGCELTLPVTFPGIRQGSTSLDAATEPVACCVRRERYPILRCA